MVCGMRVPPKSLCLAALLLMMRLTLTLLPPELTMSLLLPPLRLHSPRLWHAAGRMRGWCSCGSACGSGLRWRAQ